jgi:flagellar basal body-associated protein FliL
MPTLQAEKAQGQKKTLDEEARLQRRRDRGDLAIIIASLLAVLGIMAGAGLFAWSVSTDNLQVANTSPQVGVPNY